MAPARTTRTPKKARLAIFDIDGTIFRSSLIIESFNALIAAGVFPRKAAKQVEKSYLAWLDRKGHYNDYLMKLVHAYYEYLPGQRTDKVIKVIDKVIEWQKDRVYRYTRDLVHSLKKQGYIVIAISNSQLVMVERFAKAQHFDAAIGRVLEVKDGKYTGGILYQGSLFPIDVHVDKVALLKEHLRCEHIAADLSKSFAVGDSEGDIPLLSAVGRPIAFNPSLPLARHAKRCGWQIVVERKDVIYEIQHTRFIDRSEEQHVNIPYGKKKR